MLGTERRSLSPRPAPRMLGVVSVIVRRAARSLFLMALFLGVIAGVGRAAPAVVPSELRDVTGATIDVTALATASASSSSR